MKKLLIAMAAMAAMVMPARADEAELLARIEALEQRVAQLEALIVGGKTIPESSTEQITEVKEITLATGTWIVGEDLPAGKYYVECTSGYGSVLFYSSLEARQSDEYNYFEGNVLVSKALSEKLGEQSEDGTSTHITEINNVRLEDGNCIYTDAPTVMFRLIE